MIYDTFRPSVRANAGWASIVEAFAVDENGSFRGSARGWTDSACEISLMLPSALTSGSGAHTHIY